MQYKFAVNYGTPSTDMTFKRIYGLDSAATECLKIYQKPLLLKYRFV